MLVCKVLTVNFTPLLVVKAFFALKNSVFTKSVEVDKIMIGSVCV